MTLRNLLGHKHLTNPTLAAAVIVTLSVPHEALAFALPSLPPEITPNIEFAAKPAMSGGYLSTTVVASSSPITTPSTIVNKKTVRTRAPRGPLTEPVILEGIASYYSRAGCLGCNPLFVMANGQVLDDNAHTMAIGAHLKHLVGYQAKVTNLANGQSVVVRITDTGGFYQDKYGNRVADLTIGTKQAIGMKGGLGKVKVEVF